MESFRVLIPVPPMGSTVYKLTLVALDTAPGATVKKGRKLAVFESDKGTFDFEAPADGTIRGIHGRVGDVLKVNQPFLSMDTGDEGLRHLQVSAGQSPAAAAAAPSKPVPAPAPVWTPRALKIATDAGLAPATVTGIEATGPGGRISGDDVARYLSAR